MTLNLHFPGLPLGQERRRREMAGETNATRLSCQEKYRCREKGRHYLSDPEVT